MMETPKYYIVGSRPVKADRTSDGRFAMFAYNWTSGDFDVDMSYMATVYASGDDVVEVTPDAFDLAVERLRAKRAH